MSLPPDTTTRPDLVYLRPNPQDPSRYLPLSRCASDYAIAHRMDVIGRWLGIDERTETLLELHYTTVLLGEAMNEGVAWSDVLACTPEISELGALTFNCAEHELSPGFEKAMGKDHSFGQDLLYVEADELLDRPWGLHVLRLLAQHHGHFRFMVVGLRGLVNPYSTRQKAAAKARAEQLELLNFKRYPGTGFFFFDLGRARPVLPRHLDYTPL